MNRVYPELMTVEVEAPKLFQQRENRAYVSVSVYLRICVARTHVSRAFTVFCFLIR